jgi:hypothetical protein
MLVSLGCASRPSSSKDNLSETPDGNVEEDVSPVYPHPENFANAALHGLMMQQVGLDVCESCHQISSETDEVIPVCKGCHEEYPHDANFVEGNEHGTQVLENGKGACATNCHGVDLEGGLSGKSCNLCHNVYPHNLTWPLPKVHGVIAKDKNLCTSCHGDDLQGGRSNVSCNRCHPNYPHSENWVQADQHGAFVTNNGPLACATNCHGSNTQEGLSGVGCQNCHDNYPHADSWLAEHGSSFLNLGKGACTSCHGEDLNRIFDDKNCASCHESYPHSPTWASYENGHGERIQQDLDGNTTECKQCHGEALDRTIEGKNCFSCHPVYPHEELKDGSDEGHTFTLSHTNEECGLCHGEDLKGGARNNPACDSCHESYPHSEGWNDQDAHGSYVLNHNKEGCSLKSCHGNTFEGNKPKIASCQDCHQYPHLEKNWATGSTPAHATLFINHVQEGKEDECSGCHGENFDRLLGEGSCLTCHENGLTHLSGWDTGNEHGIYFSTSSVSTTADINCWNCHGAPVAFDNDQTKLSLQNESDCYSCHWAYPHVAYNSGSFTDNWAGDIGHLLYLDHSPLVMDANGQLPENLPSPTPAVENTCGGSTQDLCHSNGHRSSPYGLPSDLCGGYCHQI